MSTIAKKIIIGLLRAVAEICLIVLGIFIAKKLGL